MQFKDISQIISYTEDRAKKKRVEMLFSNLKNAFAVTIEAEQGSFVVTSILGDTEGVVGFTNEELENKALMAYLSMTPDKIQRMAAELQSDGIVLKKNSIRHKNGHMVDIYGVIYKLTDTTIRELILPCTKLMIL